MSTHPSASDAGARKPRGPALVRDEPAYAKLDDIYTAMKPIQMGLNELGADELKKTIERGAMWGVLKAFAAIVLLAPIWIIVVAIYWFLLSFALAPFFATLG